MGYRHRALATRAIDDSRGLALVATLIVLAVMGLVIAGAVRSALSSLRASGLDYHEARAFYAAEAGGELALSQLLTALGDGHLDDDELLAIHPPSLEGFSYDSFAVEKKGDVIVETITDGPYGGLYALTQKLDIYSMVEDANGTVAGVVLRSKAQAIPIFQFGVFFEEDLEATNGPPLEFIGRVHSNGNIYLSSDNAWYREPITTPNKIFHDRKDNHDVNDGVFINDAFGVEHPLDFDSRTIPGSEAFKSQSCGQFSCRVMTDAFDVDSLRLPLPEGMPAYELIRVREDSDGDSEREAKLAWLADTYVTVDLNDIQTKDAVCGGAGTPPGEVDGEIVISALESVYPGAGWVTFRASHPSLTCDEFDNRAELEIDGEWIFNGDMNGCTFQAFLDDAAEEIEVKVNIAADDYAQLQDDIFGMSKWLFDINSINSVDLTPWPNITVERTGGKEVPSQEDVCNIFQWNWSGFYDGREDELKDVLDIDVAQLTGWVGAAEEREAQIIYVEFLTPANLTASTQLLFDQIPDASIDPAIRMRNGASLPNPMTVATEWPVYVLADYNAFIKKPAALVGDGITIQSTFWLDIQNLPDIQGCENETSNGSPCVEYLDWASSWQERRAGETTVNAAVLAGHWPTPCDHEDAGCAGGYDDFYGGGIENFPRFLERWRDVANNPVVFRYKGSLVSLFTSQKTTGTWNGTYYVPPQRDWSFDTDFRDPEKLPPGTPHVGSIARTAMREAF